MRNVNEQIRDVACQRARGDTGSRRREGEAEGRRKGKGKDKGKGGGEDTGATTLGKTLPEHTKKRNRPNKEQDRRV